MQKPYEKVLLYLVCRERPEILGSGSQTDMEEVTKDEDKAFQLLADGRNDLRRVVRLSNGDIERHWWDAHTKTWRYGLDVLPC